jgi:glycosyltransferase involved in cell wall biosynthesis
MPISSFLPNLGGAEVGLHNIATRLIERGRKVVVMAPAPHVKVLRAESWPLSYQVEALPPKIWSLLYRAPWLGFWMLDRYFSFAQATHRFDFWHCTMGYPTGVALVHFAERRPGIRYLIRCAGEDIQRDPEIGYGARLDPSIDAIVRHYLARARILTAISDSVADEYRAIGVEDSRIRHIPNGVDLSRFAAEVDRQAVRRRLGLDPDAFLFLSVGRHHPKKNYARLIEAAAVLAGTAGLPKFQVAIVGKGASELSGEVAGEQLGERVMLIETIGKPSPGDRLQLPTSELVELYRCADAFVFPSLMETFGIAIVEAMAAGLPVIAGDSPGCRDVVRGGRDGLLADPHDARAIASAMQAMMTDGALRERHAALAAVRARDFDWERVVDRYAAVYDEAVAERPAG